MFKLGDKVQYSHTATKIRFSVGMYRSESNFIRLPIPMQSVKVGYIVGKRAMPIGTTTNFATDEDPAVFKREGSCNCYLVSFDINRRLDLVMINDVESYDGPEEVKIISPYEDTLIEVKKTTYFKKWGYISRREIIDYSKYGEEGDTMCLDVAYSLDGLYLGDPKSARVYGKKFGIRKYEKTAESHTVASIGFNPDTNTWYGWSHRAIFGFTIGSSVNFGDCGFKASNKQEHLDTLVEFWNDSNQITKQCMDHVHSEAYVLYRDDSSTPPINDEEIDEEIDELIEYDPPKVGSYVEISSNKTKSQLHWHHFEPYPDKWGRGAWTAETIEDAKQMAIDFAAGVS